MQSYSFLNFSEREAFISIHVVTDKAFQQESKNLDFFLKKKFCETDCEQLYEYVRSTQIFVPPYYRFIDAHCYWIMDEILIHSSAKARAYVIKRMIKLAQYFFNNGNYSAFLTTLSALNEKAIIRLSRSWEQVSNKYTEWFLLQFKLCLSGDHTYLLKIMTEREDPYFPYLLIIKQNYQKALENYLAKKHELGKCAHIQKERIQLEMNLFSKQMDTILIALSNIHQRLNAYINKEKKYQITSFVHRVTAWQNLTQPPYFKNFLNRSLLLE